MKKQKEWTQIEDLLKKKENTKKGENIETPPKIMEQTSNRKINRNNTGTITAAKWKNKTRGPNKKRQTCCRAACP